MRKLILVLNILVMMVCAVWGQVVWDGNEKEDLEYIDGVYHISTAAQLAKLADLVNNGEDNFKGKTVILQNNIVLNEKVLDEDGNLQNDGAGLNLWTPIGKNYQNSFKGIFNGNGKTVSGVYIVDDTEDADLGLFGDLGEGGRIQNVGVEDSYVKGTGMSASVGGVCGYSYKGTISNSYNTGLVEGGDGANVGGVCGKIYGLLSSSYNTGSVTGTGNDVYVGGVCGYSDGGSLSNSYNTGSVTGTGNNVYVGGVCGWNDDSISNSYNVGSITGTGQFAHVGGVCGYNADLLSNSYNAGSVTGTGQSAYVGGVCGYSELPNPLSPLSPISNSYNAGLVTGGDGAKVGGVCCNMHSNNDYNVITNSFYLAGTATSGIGGGDDGDLPSKKFGSEFITAIEEWLERAGDGPWQGGLSLEQDKLMLPHLNIGDNVPAISCPEEPSEINGFYEIYTATHLRWFATEVNGGDVNINGKLMQDIAVSEYTLDNGTSPADPQDYWMPIGKDHNKPFTGTFDGLGNKVSGVYIDDSNNDANLGLFGYLGADGVIENVGVVDSYVKGTGGQASIGGVCGSSEGSILSSYNAGSVKGTQSPAFVGGVCGYNANKGSISNSYNTGSVEGGDNISVGGVCGYNSRSISISISNSYNTGSVTGGDEAKVGGVCGTSSGSISNSYNIGSIEGTGAAALVGGVCGKNDDLDVGSKISNCYNAGSVEGGESVQVGGVCGYNKDNGQITDCFYLAGTATSGIGDGTDSGNENAAPKTAKELAEVMDGKLVGDLWTGFAKYESGTLTLPYFEGCEPPTVILVAVEVADAIDFENEKVKDNTNYEVATDLSFNPLLLDEITLDDNSTIYVRNKTVAKSEISDVIALSRPATPTLSADEKEITATSITLKATTDIEGRDIEYGKENTDETPTITWQSSPTFGDLTPEIEYTFYARIKATESSFASLPIEVNIKTKKGYTITIDAGITNGTVETDKTIASKGEIVTLTVTPDEDYELETLNVTGTNVSGSGNERTFEMPGEAVTVTATFKEVKPAPAPDPTPDPEPVYYTVTIPSEITGAIIHGGGTHQVREGSYIDFSIEIDPAGTGEYPTVTVDGYWWNTLRPDTRGNYRVYVYDDDCDIRIGEVSGYGTYTLTLPADSLFEGDDLYRSGVGIAVTPASSSPSSDALRYPFGTELTLTAVSDRHRAFVEWMDGSRRSPLTFRLREDTEAYAWFRALHPVGNEEIAVAGIRIRTERGGSIVIDTPKRLPIAIYALSGQCLRRSESEGMTRFSGLSEGSYLVVVGRHSEVVIVR
ncbi:GLUG motif-containing protein [uncultured Parabacteroides sp.]|uniref:GLUG motif-containing protein n=1 Tax=uncultured Parabacteroides sp. TaxID=512312 RepID=UPI00259B9BE3|nr:GLUG motif-containing protein [uncultured Parabacteroides sp.]